jgi:AAT family amino acid transporter
MTTDIIRKGRTFMSNTEEKSWLQERKLVNVLPMPLAGILNLVLVLVLAEITWFLLFSPKGPVKLYTPNVGLCVVITMLMVVHWGVDVFDFRPFNRQFLKNSNPLKKGLIVTVFYGAIAALVMYVFYCQVVGRFGAMFFSGSGLIAGGGVGQSSYTAYENGCFAQIMMNTCIIFFTIMWLTSFHYAPWEKAGKTARGVAVWVMGMFMASVAFQFLFYPHIAYMFYPAQEFMAVKPWWTGWAMTMSSMFHFSWIVPALVLLYWTNMLWEGRPWSLIKNIWLRGIVTIIGVVVLGILIQHVMNLIMDRYFEMEAFEGGQTIESPPWRWLHVAEIMMFMQAAAVILTHYFDNWPTKASLPVRAVVRTVIAVAGGMLLCWLYYRAMGPLLQLVPGIAQDGDTTLCWTVMFLILMTAQSLFFDGFPFKKRAP